MILELDTKKTKSYKAIHENAMEEIELSFSSETVRIKLRPAQTAKRILTLL
jgi:hypothetical protein